MPMINRLRVMPMGSGPIMPQQICHAFLITMREAPESPVTTGGQAMHPMHIVLTRAGEPPPFSPGSLSIGPLPTLSLPHLAIRNAREAAALVPREIVGVILRDERGRLYEKIGDRVSPVTQLFTGPRGEVIDLVAQQGSGEVRETTDQQSGESGHHLAEPAASHSESHTPASFTKMAHRLLPEPGIWRLVRYADFVDLISPQLANPHRLQPGHQLPCYLQVYELAAPCSTAELEERAMRALGKAGRPMLLSYDLCRKFALNLPRQSLGLTDIRGMNAAGHLPEGARFMTLRLAVDPTAEPLERAAGTGRQPARTDVAHRKNASPEDSAKPWEARISRDEAIYDMSVEVSRGALGRALRRLGHRIPRAAFKKWQALLRGKTADQQLWEIRPPDGALQSSRVKSWVEQTLQMGGYDVPRMLVEWEIFWRRRGL